MGGALTHFIGDCSRVPPALIPTTEICAVPVAINRCTIVVKLNDSEFRIGNERRFRGNEYPKLSIDQCAKAIFTLQYIGHASNLIARCLPSIVAIVIYNLYIVISQSPNCIQI